MSWKTLPGWWRNRIATYRLRGAKCKRCGRIHYPPRNACPYCGCRELETIELPRRGKLLSYSVVYSVPGDHRLHTPLILGLVDLGQTKVIAELTDVLPEELGSVSEVEAVVRKIDEQGENGVIKYGIKFRPAMKESGSQ